MSDFSEKHGYPVYLVPVAIAALALYLLSPWPPIKTESGVMLTFLIVVGGTYFVIEGIKKVLFRLK